VAIYNTPYTHWCQKGKMPWPDIKRRIIDMLNIPFEDTRKGMKRRWTDIRKINKISFSEVYDFIDNRRDFSYDELLQLKELVNNKCYHYTDVYQNA
jgi:hypothetical protein